MEKRAEPVEVITGDETTVRLRAQLLMPVRHRVGLIMIDAGPAVRVIGPAEFLDAGRALTRRLLEHHR